MDLKKIGRYIASKRKALGFTQAELAKKLGMSDKSVSKWERGVCLPDVSIYIQLCNILGISINEFIAGEDLDEKGLIHQADANIIAVTKDGNQKRKKLQQIFIGLSILYFIVICYMGILQSSRFGNNIEQLRRPRGEVALAETIFGESDFFLYSYSLDSSFTKMTVYMTEYQKGRVVKKSALASLKMNAMRSKGMLILLQNPEDENITVLATGDEGRITGEAPVLDGIEDKSEFATSVLDLNESRRVIKGDEVNLLCIVYSRDELVSLPMDELVREGKGSENEYMYLLSVKFE